MIITGPTTGLASGTIGLMRKNSSLVYAITLVLGDLFALILAFTIAYILRVSIDPRQLVEPIPALDYIKVFGLLAPFWLLIFAGLGLYNKDVFENRWRELWRVFVGSFAGILFIIGYDFADDPSTTIFPARLVAVYAFLLGFALVVLIRQIIWQIRKGMYRYGYGVERVMLVGSSVHTKELAERLSDTKTSGYEIAAIVGSQDAVPDGYKGVHISRASTALEQIPKLGIDTIVQTKLYESDNQNEQIQAAALKHHLDYKLMLTEHDYYGGRTEVELFQYFPVIHISPTPLLGWGRVVKRGLDLLLGTLLFILVLPILLLAGLAILIFDFGPVFFRQERLTRYGDEVRIIKFRTMKAKYSGQDPVKVFKDLDREDLAKRYQTHPDQIKNDPRVSRLGRLLRASSIDELPQLINVIKGELSLVGPRTLIKQEAEYKYREKSPLILSVKSGITGLAQVSGRNDLTIQERIRLDQYYVQNWSVWLDIKILFKTIGTVLTRRGAE